MMDADLELKNLILCMESLKVTIEVDDFRLMARLLQQRFFLTSPEQERTTCLNNFLAMKKKCSYIDRAAATSPPCVVKAKETSRTMIAPLLPMPTCFIQ